MLSLAVGDDNTALATMTPSPPIETQLAHFSCLSSLLFFFLSSRILKILCDTHASSFVYLSLPPLPAAPSMIDRTNEKKRKRQQPEFTQYYYFFPLFCCGVFCCDKVVHVCRRVLLFEGLVGWSMERARVESVEFEVRCLCVLLKHNNTLSKGKKRGLPNLTATKQTRRNHSLTLYHPVSLFPYPAMPTDRSLPLSHPQTRETSQKNTQNKRTTKKRKLTTKGKAC